MRDVTLSIQQGHGQADVPIFRHHAPSGISGWGYPGSGCADLALSILAAFLPLDAAAPRTSDHVRQRLGLPLNAEREEAAMEAMGEEARERMETEFDQAVRALPVRLWDGQYVRREVFELHQAFKADVLVPLDGDAPHLIPAARIRDWLTQLGAGES